MEASGTTTTATPAPAATGAALKRDALVFIPGIERTWTGRSIRDVASDVVDAFNNLTAGLTFTATPSEPLLYSDDDPPLKSEVMTIFRATSGDQNAQPTPILDIYSFEYHRTLTDDQDIPLVVRAVQVFLAIVLGVSRVGRLVTPWLRLITHVWPWQWFSYRKVIGNPKKPSESFQLLFVVGVLFLYAAFLGLLTFSIGQMLWVNAQAVLQGQSLPAAPGALPTAIPSPTPSPAAGAGAQGWFESLGPTFAPVGGFFSGLWGRAQPFVAGLARFVPLLGVLFWLILPPRSAIKSFVTDGATDYLAIDYYLREGARGSEMHGFLERELDRIRDHPTIRYQDIHLASYSFGTVLAINALFPYSQAPLRGSSLRDVQSLTTIGCPFDVVRLVRPDYFLGRAPAERSTPLRWLNIYTPTDVLGSNLRNDDALGQPDPDVWKDATHNLIPLPTNAAFLPGGARPDANPLSAVALNGMKAHAAYWDPGHHGERTCFAHLVDFLYGGGPVMGVAPATPDPVTPPPAPAPIEPAPDTPAAPAT